MSIGRGRALLRPRRRCLPALAAGLLAVLPAAACTPAKPTATIDASKMAAVLIGRSSRSDVFATLGRPARTEQSRAGERWIYEARPDSQGNAQLISGAGAAAGAIGAFVPFVGLVGPGLGLVNAASDTPRPQASASFSVDFGADGVVRDCVYASSDIPAGLQGAPASRPLACGSADAAPHR